MSGDKAKVLFVGALTLDTVYHVPGFAAGPGKYISQETTRMASGMAANAATAAARLGGCPSLWASVGSDDAGPSLIAEIAAEGVDCTSVRRVAGGRSASAAIAVDERGERWVLVDYDPRTQAAPGQAEVPDVRGFAAVMVDTRWPEAARIALEKAREAGMPAILDADVAESETLAELASNATHIVASASGASILSGEQAPDVAAMNIARRFDCMTCVTDGSNGAFWMVPDGADLQVVPAPKVEAVDTNGAGDVFHGGFAQTLAEGASLEASIQFASAAAALKCTVFGGRLGAPDRNRTLRFMKDVYNAEI